MIHRKKPDISTDSIVILLNRLFLFFSFLLNMSRKYILTVILNYEYCFNCTGITGKIITQMWF